MNKTASEIGTVVLMKLAKRPWKKAPESMGPPEQFLADYQHGIPDEEQPGLARYDELANQYLEANPSKIEPGLINRILGRVALEDEKRHQGAAQYVRKVAPGLLR